MTTSICVNANKACAILNDLGILTQVNFDKMVDTLEQPAKGYLRATDVMDFAHTLKTEETEI